MAKTISTISTKLIADASGLRAGFASATGIVEGFAGRIKGVVAGIGGAFAGMFAVAKIKETISGQMDWIDQLAKQSDQLGIATEQLQGYRHAADLAGIDAESFALGLKTQQKLLSEAATGTKGAAETFAELGLSVQGLRGMSAGKQFETVVAALERVKNQTDRTRLALEVFGKGGQGFLSLDSAQLKQAADEIERFGGGISRVDAAKVEQANDAITTMKAAVSALTAELAISLSPTITAVAQSVTAFAAWIGTLDGAMIKNTAEIVAFSLAFAGTLAIIPRIVSAVRAVIVTLKALAVAQATTSALAGPAGWIKLAAAAGVAVGATLVVEKAFGGLNTSMDQSAAAAKQAAGGLAVARGQSDALNASLATSAGASGAAADALAGVGQRSERTAEQIAALKRIQQIKTEGDAAFAALEAAKASGNQVAIGVATAAVDQLNARLQEAKAAAAGSSGAMADGFTKAAAIVRDAAESLRGASDTGAQPLAAGAVASVGQLTAGLREAGAAANQTAEAARGISAGSGPTGGADVLATSLAIASMETLIKTLSDAKAAAQESSGTMSAGFASASDQVAKAVAALDAAASSGTLPARFAESAAEAKRVMADLEQAIKSRSFSAAGVAMSAVDGLVDRLARARDAAAESSGEMARGYASVASRVAAAGPIVPQVDTSAIDAAARQIKPIRPEADTSAVAAALHGIAPIVPQVDTSAVSAAVAGIPPIKPQADTSAVAAAAAIVDGLAAQIRGSGTSAGDGFATSAKSINQLIATLQEAAAAARNSSGEMSYGFADAAAKASRAVDAMGAAAGSGVIAAGFQSSADEAKRILANLQASVASETPEAVSSAVGAVDALVAQLTRAKEPTAQAAGTMVRNFGAAASRIRGIPIVPTVDTTTASESVAALDEQIRRAGATAVETSAEISGGFNATAGSVATAASSVGYLVDDLESARATASLLAGGVTSSVAGVIRASRALESARMTGDPAAIAAASDALDRMNARLGQAKSAAAESAGAIANGFQLAADEVEKSTTKVATWADHLKSLQSEATGINKQFRTPEQKYADEMLALKEMVKEGMVFGDAARRAGANYREELAKALGIQKETTREQSKPLAGVGAVQSGTSAAYSAIQSSAREWTQQTKTQTAQLKAQEAANKKLDAIVANTKDKLKLDTVSL